MWPKASACNEIDLAELLTFMPEKQRIAIVSIEWDVVDLIESLNRFDIVGFFDPNRNRSEGDFRCLGPDEAWESVKRDEPLLKVALVIDQPTARARLFNHYGSNAVVTLQSPHAHVASRTQIGHGSILQRGVSLLPNARIGVACKLNVNVFVDHDCRIADFTTLAPGSMALGGVTIEEGVYIGAGAIIRQGHRVGAGATVGAGAVVVKDVPPHAVVVGVPASRRLR